MKDRRRDIEEELQEDVVQSKRRQTSRTVELETIKEEKSYNYSRNKKLAITFSILSFCLIVYIIYLVVMTFMP